MIKKKLASCVLLLALTGCAKATYYSMGKGDDIASQAKNNEESMAWATNAVAFQRGNNKRWESGQPKCNLFVHDMLHDAGISNPPRKNGGWAIQAGDWANPNYSITNWKHMGNNVPWKPGDVIAEARSYYSDATGHCGIAISSSKVMAAGTEKVHSNSTHNLTGGVVRRYTGDEKTTQ